MVEMACGLKCHNKLFLTIIVSLSLCIIIIIHIIIINIYVPILMTPPYYIVYFIIDHKHYIYNYSVMCYTLHIIL